MSGLLARVSAGLGVLLYVLLFSVDGNAQNVANFSSGKLGTKDYEEIHFWVENENRAEITYRYGKKIDDIQLTFEGTELLAGKPSFKVKFPNGHLLYITPLRTALQVSDSKGSKPKLFRWYYEGPVNGRGTFCSVCAQDTDEALQVIRTS